MFATAHAPGAVARKPYTLVYHSYNTDSYGVRVQVNLGRGLPCKFNTKSEANNIILNQGDTSDPPS